MDFYTFYTNLLWFSAYIYGVLKPIVTTLVMYSTRATKVTYTYIYNYFNNKQIGEILNDNIRVYMSDGEKMLPFSFDTIRRQTLRVSTTKEVEIHGISKLHTHHLLYYVILKIDDTHNKVIVFNSLDKLVFMYSNLEDLVRGRMSKFSKFLEVRITNNTTVDHLDTFSEYTDKSDSYFSEITGYNIRARDIYDFLDSRFLLESGEKLRVTKMDLSSHEYHYAQELRL